MNLISREVMTISHHRTAARLYMCPIGDDELE
jgi:hypothetical protein